MVEHEDVVTPVDLHDAAVAFDEALLMLLIVREGRRRMLASALEQGMPVELIEEASGICGEDQVRKVVAGDEGLF